MKGPNKFKILSLNPLTHKFLFCIFNPPQGRFFSNYYFDANSVRRGTRKHRDHSIVINLEEGTMKRISCITIGLIVVALAIGGCGNQLNTMGWVTLIEGETGLENWERVGGANWRAEGGAIVADKSTTEGSSFLVTKNSYKDFEIRAELWAESNTNSGIFIRCSDPRKITAANSYEVNIWDTRPDPTYGTGAIVDVASVPVPIIHKAGGKWNTLEITARGPELTVVLNGVVTVNVRNSKFAEGTFALQFAGGPIKWRKVQVRPL
jgi:hypothetical protein